MVKVHYIPDRYNLICLFLLFLVLVGCTEDKNTFHVEGPIEDIKQQSSQIYVDGFWLPIKNIENYKVGDVIKAEVESIAEGDQYDPEKIKVHKMELNEHSVEGSEKP
ncbi:hypothetical protein ABES58_33050 [Paenibacillus lautus]|uniref:hypothetical protein n=1 Tax=Paenibacillus lautus TaxID=1401 RepID=UPI003D2A236B